MAIERNVLLTIAFLAIVPVFFTTVIYLTLIKSF